MASADERLIFTNNFVSKDVKYLYTRLLKSLILKRIDNKLTLIDNQDIKPNDIPWSNKNQEICYVGGIARIRGVLEIIKSLNNKNFKLNLAGEFSSVKYESECKNALGWNRVNFLGFLDRKGVKNVYKNSKLGMVTLYPIINYLDALPVKMFEYMSAGIPVVSSDFPLWKEIVEGNNCGLTVDPKDPKEISGAIEKLLSNDKLAEEMGQNGKKAIFEKYNWGIEEKKLLNIYKKILK